MGFADFNDMDGRWSAVARNLHRHRYDLIVHPIPPRWLDRGGGSQAWIVKLKVTFQTRSRIENCILFPFGFVGGIRWVPSPSDKKRNTNSVAICPAEKQLSFLFWEYGPNWNYAAGHSTAVMFRFAEVEFSRRGRAQ